MRFKLETKNDSLGLNFADPLFKEVHAGHWCMAQLHLHNIQILDHKTGGMANEIYAAKKAGSLTREQ